jgi:SAM-dependent methyltransferase
MSEGDPFDRYEEASDYEAAVAQSIAFAHVGHEMFIEAKALALVEVVERLLGTTTALDFLDVGCGVGAMQKYVRPVARRSVGIDTSAESIAAARRQHPESELSAYDGERIPFDDASFDVTFAVNVVHHVDPPERARFAAELSRVTRASGLVVIFEQNPLNPLTRLAVARCAFDEGVVLWGRGRIEELVAGTGGTVVDRRYILFFPIHRDWARSIERRLGWLPLGAQHMVAARPGHSKA